MGDYKVPFREVYCSTMLTWLKATIWCHLVLKAFPYARSTHY